MNPSRGINDNHLIPITQFVTLDIQGINIQKKLMKAMVTAKDKQFKPQWI
jgi:hypothetical protein